MSKKFLGALAILAALAIGCSSSNNDKPVNTKNFALPDYVKSSSALVQDTYVLAAEHPDVLKNVQCFCGCGVQEGHKSNLDCFVKKMDSDNKNVLAWDPMGIS